MRCEYALSEVVEIIGGGTPKTGVADYWNGKIPWLSVKDFNDDLRYVYDSEKKITELGLNNSATTLLQKDDIIISARGTVGELAMIPYPMAFNQSCYGIRAIKEKIDSTYLYYFLKDNVRILKQRTHGSVFDTITRKTFDEIVIQLPDMEKQLQVTSTLAALDDKIELNQRINENLEWQAKALFKSWFVDFEPFGREIPADWEQLSFSEFLTASTEKSNDPFLPMFSVTDKGIFPRDEKFKKNLSMTNLKSKVIHQTDLVFGMSREILNWGIMRYPTGGVSSAYNVYHVDEKVNTFYLESYMKANYQYFKDLIKPASREGQGIDKSALMQKMILMPTQTVLDHYYNIEDTITRAARHVLEENQKLSELRDILLPKLMSGEIDVSAIQD